jgi:tetrapyrrole methylase family protein/MazG family protein
MEPTPSSARAPEPVPSSDPRLQAIARLLGVVDRLRAPDGCPWDKKQTVASMAPHLVEEAHEALEAVESGSDADVIEESGDLLMVVTLIARIAQDEGRFDLGHAADAIAEKLVRRHPHVFGEVKAESADEVLANWEAIKKGERAEKQQDDSALAGVPKALPALQRAHRVAGKAISAGFRWSDAGGALEKLQEEQRELEEALGRPGIALDARSGTKPLANASPEERAAIEHELGDVLIAAAFLGTYLDLDPERLCREAVRRFERRFRALESSIAGPIGERPQDELVRAWEEAKRTTG